MKGRARLSSECAGLSSQSAWCPPATQSIVGGWGTGCPPGPLGETALEGGTRFHARAHRAALAAKAGRGPWIGSCCACCAAGAGLGSLAWGLEIEKGLTGIACHPSSACPLFHRSQFGHLCVAAVPAPEVPKNGLFGGHPLLDGASKAHRHHVVLRVHRGPQDLGPR